MHNIARKPPETAVKELLASAQLPVADITPAHLEHFFGAWAGAALEGIVGMELLGSVALLRSLTVATPRRRSGLGAALLAHAERHAMERGVRSLFLLTTTAERYFARHGYATIPRDTAPVALRNTTEFATLCPVSAVLMVKQLCPVSSQ